jgi:hypothetical protein
MGDSGVAADGTAVSTSEPHMLFDAALAGITAVAGLQRVNGPNQIRRYEICRFQMPGDYRVNGMCADELPVA